MITWMRRNLFRSITDTILTVISASILGYVIFQVFQFVFVTGRWEIIQVNLKILLVGRFPEELMFLVGFSILATCFSIASLASGMNRPLDQPPTLAGKLWELFQRFGLIIATSAFLIVLAGDLDAVLFGAYVVLSIFAGRLFGTARRTTLLRRLPGWLWLSINATLPLVLIFLTMGQAALEEWGGFLINFYLAVVSIALSFPLGVMLALGRRSTLPLLRWLSTAYIELIRGAPLFVLLLLAGVALEFFIPASIAPDAIFRAVTVFTLFTAAYLAEVIRGGLQSIPKGQAEAGKALGLSTFRITFLITLPQALRNVIPAQIGQFISLFKDTTLAGVALSVFDLLNVGTAITKQDDYLGQGLIYESLAFVGLLFWVGSYVMSRESQRIEKKLGVGIR
ncbi:MAG: general L-amino acid transport system permease protein [Aquiluna sp.]|mgnify:FL=1|jgi:general L-amino acid transport system permease protein|tara:strand:+ start:171 stop:1355 length:1185 start_codon:yes stop_codon:yes gene_type:complete